MKEINKTVGDLQLERYLLGELSGGERARIRRQLQSDEVLRSRLSALERSNSEILEACPAKRMEALIRERLNDTELRALVEIETSANGQTPATNNDHIRLALHDRDRRKRRKRVRHEQ